MDLKDGDLVVTLPKVENIRVLSTQLKEGMVGVICQSSPSFDRVRVYAVAIEGQIYYLFEDEIIKLEEEC